MGARGGDDDNTKLSGGDVDLISGLGDDVLALILDLVPDATDLVRTAALSRRWRGLWTRVPALRFVSTARPDFTSPSGAERYVAFVNDALALRAAAQAEPALEHLSISFTMERRFNVSFKQLVPLPVGAARGWIHFAIQQSLKSFDLEMHRPYRMLSLISNKPTVIMDLDTLPSSAKLETMRLSIDNVVRLPSAAVFVSLKSLSLESVAIMKGTSDQCHLLARLLSTECCPSLQKVRLRRIKLDHGGLEEQQMLIEAAALLEMSLEEVSLTTWLGLETPNLRILRMKDCVMETLTISAAPRLEELYLETQPDYISVNGDLPCVWRLKAELHSHGFYDDYEDNDVNDGTMCLLHCCSRSARHLEVSLHVSEVCF